jgi:hypothetical protein
MDHNQEPLGRKKQHTDSMDLPEQTQPVKIRKYVMKHFYASLEEYASLYTKLARAGEE